MSPPSTADDLDGLDVLDDLVADENDLECAQEPHADARNGLPEVQPEALARAADIFRACGDPARLRTLVRLSAGEACVTELANEFDEGLSTTSQRLRRLRIEGLVERRREGKHAYYSLADNHVFDLLRVAFEHAEEST
jgi:ArsR family transcriptional regulator